MPLQATSGAASYDAFGGGVAAVPNYIEDVFSTYLYTGTGASQTITNGIDLSTKGGMVWLKARNDGTFYHQLIDTSRGALNRIASNSTDAQTNDGVINSFTSSGFVLNTNYLNSSGQNNASWTFRKQPKFFDVVTYTGNGTARTISHSLGSVPACIIVKQTSAAGEDWAVYHRGLPLVAGSLNDNFLTLNTTSAYSTSTDIWNRTVPTSTVFSVGNHPSTNSNGASYVAYLFAHDAGGFGLTGTDNVISCGSFTTDGSGNATVSLGYEAQWVLMKKSSGAEGWMLFDNMRGLVVQPATGNFSRKLVPNLTNAEADGDECRASSTGFNVGGVVAGATYIYIAIRRGPMKVPTSGTSVFTPLTYTNPGTGTTITSLSFPADVVFTERRDASAHRPVWDRLRGATKAIYTNLTGAEGTVTDGLTNFASNVGYTVVNDNGVDGSQVNYVFRRAPSFFDEVCYTGTGSARTVTHNLGVAPELMIVKNRSIASDWRAYSASLGATQNLKPNTTDAATSSTLIWNDTAPTSSVFTVGTAAGVNGSGNTYVAYLFATCAGVSKVGSYTGTATTLQVDCGFTGGARFVLIKRTDSTGDWYVWDSARGIVAGNDPYLLLNSTAAEVTSTDYIDTYSAGFEISSTAPAAINASGGTFIFLAIA